MLRFIHSSVPMGLGYEEISVVQDDFEEEELDELVVLVINSLAPSGGNAAPSFRDALGPADGDYSPASPTSVDNESDAESTDESLVRPGSH